MSGRKYDVDGANELLKGKSIGQWISEGAKEIADALEGDKRDVVKKLTCHNVALDLFPQKYSKEQVKEARRLLGCSQNIFARFLGVSLSTVRSWEQGINTPEHVACRLMDEIRYAPKYWRKRLLQSVVRKNPATASQS